MIKFRKTFLYFFQLHLYRLLMQEQQLSDDLDIHEVAIAFSLILRNLRMKERKLSRVMITKSGNIVLKKISANHMNQNWKMGPSPLTALRKEMSPNPANKVVVAIMGRDPIIGLLCLALLILNVEKILKGNLDSILSRSPSVKIQIMHLLQLIKHPILRIPNFNFPNLRCCKVFFSF